VVHAAVAAATLACGLVGFGAASGRVALYPSTDPQRTPGALPQLGLASQFDLAGPLGVGAPLGVVRTLLPPSLPLPWPGLPRPDAQPAATDDDGATTAITPSNADLTDDVADASPAPILTRKYVVEPGDTVQSIAFRFGVSNETVIWENDLTDPDILAPGQTLEILPFTGLVHQVRPGDTVASIANFYEARIEDVVRVNRLHDPFIIVVGQKIAVPGGYRPLPGQNAQDTANDGSAGASDSTDQQAASVGKRKPLPVLGSTPQEKFISVIAPSAVESQVATGVPASVTIAQAIIESYWGSSRLSADYNNYFGIKADTKPGTAGVISFDTWEVLGGRSVVVHAPFRAYNSLVDSFMDHGRFFLENARYAGALAVKDDARAFAQAIARAGYATDPGYGGKLIQLMDRYDLYRYDDV
jgi:flagellum-specific peptidoglycan hydrolase FlgJ